MAKKPTKARTSRKPAAQPAKSVTKQSVVLAMLRRANGASIDEMIDATSWQPHSVRGFISGVLKRRLEIDVMSEKGEDGVRRYYVAPLKS